MFSGKTLQGMIDKGYLFIDKGSYIQFRTTNGYYTKSFCLNQDLFSFNPSDIVNNTVFENMEKQRDDISEYIEFVNDLKSCL